MATLYYAEFTLGFLLPISVQDSNPNLSLYSYPSPAMCVSHNGSFTLLETDSGMDSDSGFLFLQK